MPRKRRMVPTQLPFHVTARCINREWFRLPLPIVWRVFSDYLYFAHHAYGLSIYAFVLMSNHFHLLASASNGNFSKCMWYLMSEVAHEITRLAGRENQTFGSPHKPCLIDSDRYFLTAYRYIYRNPVEAKIVSRVEDYQFSTLHGLIGRSRLTIPIVQDGILFSDLSDGLNWLNTKYGPGEKPAISKALNRKTFELPKDRSTRRLIEIKRDIEKIRNNAGALPLGAAHLLGKEE